MDNILACMNEKFTDSGYKTHDTQLIIATSISFAFFAVELFGFIFALSVAVVWQNLFSMACHAAGLVTLLFYIFFSWCSDMYWFVFGFCSALPAVVELVVWITKFAARRYT